MKYAVVCFLEESSCNNEIVQEVPVIWLKNRNTICLWPPNNSAYHVQNSTEPTEGWFECRVRCDRICDSLLDARKKCIESSSEDELGKGLRKKVHTKHLNDYKRSCPSPPTYSSDLPYIPNSDSSCSSQVQINAAGMQNNPDLQEYTVLEPYRSEQTGYPVINDIASDEKLQNNTEYQPANNIESQPANNTESQPANNGTLVDIASLEHKIDKIIGMQARILSSLEDLKVSNISQQIPNNGLAEIKRLLPFENFEAFKEFDQSLKEDTELCKKMVSYCGSIGGLSAKDLHNRNMSTIMTNVLAESCSWKGLRDNHRIGDFRTLECLLESVQKLYPTTQKEFEILTKDWLRHAKQRRQRQEKADR